MARRSGVVELGEQLDTSFLGRTRPRAAGARSVGRSASEWAGQPLQLVAPAAGKVAVDRGVAGGVTLASLASVERLAESLGEDTIDRARFRMLFWVDGLGPHEEDAWVGSQVQLGEAVVQFRGHVGRCAVTSQYPATGQPDLDTLGGLRSVSRSSDHHRTIGAGCVGRSAPGWTRAARRRGARRRRHQPVGTYTPA